MSVIYDGWYTNLSTTLIMPVPTKGSTAFLIRLRLIATLRHRLINPLSLCPFLVVCTMTTDVRLEGEITPGYVK
jgi:hypothetical protein